MKKLTLALLAVLLFAWTAAAAPVTTVILVRHAEKADDGTKDPPLTEEGKARAQELVRVLRGAGITKIYTTNLRRTRSTAQPIAAALRLEPVVNTPGETYAKDIAKRIRTHHAGAVVLLVGHTNTTHDVMEALGVTNPPTIPETDFDNLFIVTLSEGNAPRLVSLKYGQ